jgi:prolyl-tRNA synthetase
MPTHVFISIQSRRDRNNSDDNQQYDGRNRLSHFWTPTKSKSQDNTSQEDGHDLLVRAGFLRQAHSGIFHLLPLGLRVQNKLEALIDKHMSSLGATKVSLSSISSEELWQRSGRLEGRDSEFLRLQDRKGAKYLLSPTHEEEITEIVASAVNSYKDLPLRLYQVTRKYRDEARPRQGLLRGREFLMKDLYTFDSTEEQARETYDQVRNAYSAFFDELNLPYLVASADSGSMGGSLSHEYHLASANGEDNIISCKKCDYSTNEELYPGTLGPHELNHAKKANTDINTILTSTPFLSKDKNTIFNVVTPRNSGPINTHLLKKLHPSLDTTLENAFAVWSSLNQKSPDRPRTEIQILDGRLAHLPLSNPTGPTIPHPNIALTAPSETSTCPSCSSPSSLKISKAIEIGHTFHLGTRYSAPLNAQVLSSSNKLAPIAMGCHGIGVSRLLAAAASQLTDSKGLNWPVKIAPFTTVIVAAPKAATEEDLARVYDVLAKDGQQHQFQLNEDRQSSSTALDVTLDDRDRPLGWKLRDADLIGYPFIVVLGKAWKAGGKVELQCRRLEVREEVSLEELGARLRELEREL